MNDLVFRTEKLTGRITRIHAFCGEIMYLVEGADRAALIDTGSGIGDLKKCVDHLTDKPCIVLLTHGHVDHAMGAAQFDPVYMNFRDEHIFRQHATQDFREESLQTLVPPYQADASDLQPSPDPGSFRDLEEGDRFDLGGITVEVYACPGHTPGSMVMLFPEERILLTGDACNPFTFLFDTYSTSVEEYEESLKALDEKLSGRFDRILVSHGSGEGYPEMIRDVIQVCEDIKARRTDDIPFDFRNRKGAGLIAKETFFSDDPNVRMPGNIVYNPDRIRREQIRRAKADEIEARVQDLLSRMTLEEKIGQTRQCGPSLVGAFDMSFEEALNMMFDGKLSKADFDKMLASAEMDLKEDDIRAGRIGSFNGVNGAEQVHRIQQIAVEETRLGIPLLIGCDVIHGHRTITPIPLAESGAFEPSLWERTARMSAKEAAADGVKWTFAPMVDVAKDARWGRISEGAGEDTLMNSLYGEAKVRGYQTGDPSASDAIAACVKHFAAYGGAEGGRDYNRVELSEQRLREDYLPSYEASVKTGALTVMPAFNDISGVPCSCNSFLLTAVLRGEWGFEGMTISDANAVAELVAHGAAADRRDAARLAMNAGMDMDMTSECFIEELKGLVESGAVSEETLDRAVADILRVKFALGLFENPYYMDEQDPETAFLKPEYRALAREAAVKSIVLLKNDPAAEGGAPILPLSRDLHLGICGDLASRRDEMPGTWAVNARSDEHVSVIDACEAQKVHYTYLKTADADEIAAHAAECDVFVAVIGEPREWSGEAASRSDLKISADQLEMVQRLLDTGKPVVTVLFNGRPIELSFLKEHVPAIVEAWHLGVEAGNAVLDILFGDVNPSAKLTASFPYNAGTCPCYYDRPNTGRPGGRAKFTSKYFDAPLAPVYSFGDGLSYTTYEYTDLYAQAGPDGIDVRITVKNTGSRAGDEVVLCFFRDPVAERVRPVRKLAAFEKVPLVPGESKVIRFRIAREQLGYFNSRMDFVVDPGEIDIYAGGSLSTCLETSVQM